jgi:hypothetical protein
MCYTILKGDEKMKNTKQSLEKYTSDVFSFIPGPEQRKNMTRQTLEMYYKNPKESLKTLGLKIYKDQCLNSESLLERNGFLMSLHNCRLIFDVRIEDSKLYVYYTNNNLRHAKRTLIYQEDIKNEKTIY